MNPESTKPGERPSLDKVVNDLISEEANESIRHFDSRLSNVQEKFLMMKFALETFEFLVDDLIGRTVAESLIELETDRIRKELQVQIDLEEKQKKMVELWNDRAEKFQHSEFIFKDEKENRAPNPRQGPESRNINEPLNVSLTLPLRFRKAGTV